MEARPPSKRRNAALLCARHAHCPMLRLSGGMLWCMLRGGFGGGLVASRRQHVGTRHHTRFDAARRREYLAYLSPLLFKGIGGCLAAVLRRSAAEREVEHVEHTCSAGCTAASGGSMAVATTRAALITTGRARTWRGAVGRQTTIASSSRYTGVSTVHGTGAQPLPM